MTGPAKRLVLVSLAVAVIAVGCTGDGSDVSGPTTSAPASATGPTTATENPTTSGGITTAPTTSGGETTEPTSGGETSGPSGPTLRTPSPAGRTSGPTSAPSESPLPGGPPASTTMSGTWSGEWVDPGSGTTASLVFSLHQDGSALTGSVTIDGTSCLSGGAIEGEAHANAVRIEVRDREVLLTYNGTLNGKTMSGDYTSSCDAPHGTWRVTKQQQ